jgi:hypothetical protein
MLRAVEDAFWATGAKAAAPATREAKITVFILYIVEI